MKIQKFTILPEFKDWAIEILNSNHEREVQDRTAIYEGLHKRAGDLQEHLDNLVRMLYSGRIDDTTYDREKIHLNNELTSIQSQLRRTEERANDWLELSEKTFYFAAYAHKAFAEGDVEIRREIMMCMGYNPKLLNGELHIEPSEWLQPILMNYPDLQYKYRTPEPSEIGYESTKKQVTEPVHLLWQGY